MMEEPRNERAKMQQKHVFARGQDLVPHCSCTSASKQKMSGPYGRVDYILSYPKP